MFIGPLARGGAERRLLTTAVGLRDRGYQIKVISNGPLPLDQASLYEDFKANGIDFGIASDFSAKRQEEIFQFIDKSLVPKPGDLPLWFVYILKSFACSIADYRPAVVHGWIDRLAITAALAALSLGAPRIVVGQTSVTPEMRGYPDAEFLLDGYRAVASGKNVVFVNNSARSAAAHERWINLRRGTIKVVYGSLQSGRIRVPHAEDVKTFRNSLGIPTDALVVGSVMRFDSSKDPVLWIKTAAEIAKAKPNVYFVLAGHGVLQSEIRDEMSSRGLDGRVIFVAPDRDINLVYAIFDALLLTSAAEGLPNVLLEAQAAGVPVVTTDVGGTSEAVLDGVTGMVCPDRSEQSLAVAVLAILNDEGWRLKARLAGPKFIEARFGFDRMVADTLNAYRLPQSAGLLGGSAWSLACDRLFRRLRFK